MSTVGVHNYEVSVRRGFTACIILSENGEFAVS